MMVEMFHYYIVKNKNHSSGRVVEELFLTGTGPKRGYLSYLIQIREIIDTSDVCFSIITVLSDMTNTLFLGPALDKNKPSTTRPDQCFFLKKISRPFFFSIK